MRREKRRDSRYPVTWELRGKSLRPLEPASRVQVEPIGISTAASPTSVRVGSVF